MTKTESIGETVSKDEVLALINKAMDNTDNKDIQDYIFCGLRRDVNNLPSINRPKGEWVKYKRCDPVGDEIYAIMEAPDGKFFCNRCGKYAIKSDYCPNCGSYMRNYKGGK